MDAEKFTRRCVEKIGEQENVSFLRWYMCSCCVWVTTLAYQLLWVCVCVWEWDVRTCSFSDLCIPDVVESPIVSVHLAHAYAEPGCNFEASCRSVIVKTDEALAQLVILAYLESVSFQLSFVLSTILVYCLQHSNRSKVKRSAVRHPSYVLSAHLKPQR